MLEEFWGMWIERVSVDTLHDGAYLLVTLADFCGRCRKASISNSLVYRSEMAVGNG